MPAVYEVRYSLLRVTVWTTQFYQGQGFYYELDAERHLDVIPQPVWCRRCRRFRDGEWVEALADIDREIAELSDPERCLTFAGSCLLSDPSEDREFREWFADRRLGDTRHRREWREGRNEPPKCLECGSTEIVEFPPDVRVSNPQGPGQIELRCVGMYTGGVVPTFYTPEGDRIVRDERGTRAVYERLLVRRHGLFNIAFPFETDVRAGEESNPWNY